MLWFLVYYLHHIFSFDLLKLIWNFNNALKDDLIEIYKNGDIIKHL